MAKTKKTKKNAAKPKIKVRDLKAKKDPKGGGLGTSPTLTLQSPDHKITTAPLDSFLKINS